MLPGLFANNQLSLNCFGYDQARTLLHIRSRRYLSGPFAPTYTYLAEFGDTTPLLCLVASS